jgi:NAD(P)-dependent dehydrogenase (short-subunit alcohol dehydrogenase family)
MTQSALIIGAGDATGGAIALAFAREGLIACVNRRARNADKLEELAQSIRDEGHHAIAMPGDARGARDSNFLRGGRDVLRQGTVGTGGGGFG